MSDLDLEVNLISYVLLIILYLLYGVIYKDFKLTKIPLKGKFIFGSASGIIASIMISINSLSYIVSDKTFFSETLIIYLLVLIILFSGIISSVITLLMMILTYFFLGNISVLPCLKILQIVFLLFFLNILCNKFRMNDLWKWLITTITIMISTIIYLLFISTPFILIVGYILYILSLQINVFFYLFIYIVKFNKKMSALYNGVNNDYVSNVLNYHKIDEKFKIYLKNNQNFIVALITINNYKMIRSKLKYTTFNYILYNIGNLIKNYVKDIADVGRISNDQYCLLFYKDINDVDKYLSTICENIEKIYKNSFNISLKKNIINGETITLNTMLSEFSNPNYLFQN